MRCHSFSLLCALRGTRRTLTFDLRHFSLPPPATCEVTSAWLNSRLTLTSLFSSPLLSSHPSLLSPLLLLHQQRQQQQRLPWALAKALALQKKHFSFALLPLMRELRLSQHISINIVAVSCPSEMSLSTAPPWLFITRLLTTPKHPRIGWERKKQHKQYRTYKITPN